MGSCSAFFRKILDAHGPLKPLLKIGLFQTVDTHGSCPVGCMNKFIVSDVDAYMADRSFGTEKNQVSRFQFVTINANANHGLFSRCPRQLDIEEFIHFPYKGGAVDSLNCYTTHTIGRAQKSGCDFHKQFSFIRTAPLAQKLISGFCFVIKVV